MAIILHILHGAELAMLIAVMAAEVPTFSGFTRDHSLEFNRGSIVWSLIVEVQLKGHGQTWCSHNYNGCQAWRWSMDVKNGTKNEQDRQPSPLSTSLQVCLLKIRRLSCVAWQTSAGLSKPCWTSAKGALEVMPARCGCADNLGNDCPWFPRCHHLNQYLAILHDMHTYHISHVNI